jgi:hypothetical protein
MKVSQEPIPNEGSSGAVLSSTLSLKRERQISFPEREEEK